LGRLATPPIPDPWVSCLNVVTELTHHVNAQQVAVDPHQVTEDNVQDALDAILANWGAELNRLKAQKAVVATIANAIENTHYALEDADQVHMCSAEEKRLYFLQSNLDHYTRRLRELGNHPTA